MGKTVEVSASFTRRLNLGNYEHAEASLTARTVFNEGEGADLALESAKLFAQLQPAVNAQLGLKQSLAVALTPTETAKPAASASTATATTPAKKRVGRPPKEATSATTTTTPPVESTLKVEDRALAARGVLTSAIQNKVLDRHEGTQLLKDATGVMRFTDLTTSAQIDDFYNAFDAKLKELGQTTFKYERQ